MDEKKAKSKSATMLSMKRKALLPAFLLVASLVFACVLWSCDSQPPQSFTVVKAWWPAWDTFQVGVQQREEVRKSFHTTFLQEEDYVPALRAFQTEEVDAATLTIYEAIMAASQGTALKIVLLLDYTTGSDGLVAEKSVKSLLDLKGKRIGVERGTIAHFTVLKALEKAGLDQTEVELVNLDLDALQQAFLHDEVDAAGIYEPYMSNMARQGNGHVVFSSQEIPRAICDVLFVKEAIARDHPDVVDHWIEAWNDALTFKGSDPEDYFRTLSQLNGTPIPDLQQSFDGIFFTNLVENRIALGTPDRPGYLLESLTHMEEFMFEQGVIKEHLPVEALVEFEGIGRFFTK